MPAKPHTGTSLHFSAYRTAEVRTRQLESLAPWPPLLAESPAALLTGAWLSRCDVRALMDWSCS